MTGPIRLSIAARAFFLATVLGLAVVFREPRVFQGIVLLSAVAGLAIAATQLLAVGTRWVTLFEGVLAGLIIAVTLPEGAILMPYLIVPPLLAGVASGSRAVIIVAGGQVFGLLLVLGLGGGDATTRLGIELAAPWAIASVGAGLMGVWVNALRGNPGEGDDASYQSARRLLSQLRTVTRRLSAGLDPATIADQILAQVGDVLGPSPAAVYARSENDAFVPLTHRGAGDATELGGNGEEVRRSISTLRPQLGAIRHGDAAEVAHRTVLPLRSAGRAVGVVVVRSASPPDARLLEGLMARLDEHSLRLDTALVFDEVRAYATLEERQRLAREIHDGVAQEVASLGYAVDDLAADASAPEQRARLDALRAEITRVVSELRLSIFDLRSGVDTSRSLGSALSDYVRTVGARSGMTVHLSLEEGAERLRPEVEAELLRIAQEAVTNARKHAQAKNLWVDCAVDPPTVRISVSDDGTGLGPGRADSYGLSIMRERAERIGATLRLSEADRIGGARGTTVTVTIGDATETTVRTPR